MRKLTVLTTAALILAMSGCATQRYPMNTQNQYPAQYPGQYQTQYPAYGQSQPVYPNQYQNAYIDTAVIVGMREVNVGGGTSGGGAVVGALIGGVLGHQVGKGSGRDLATIGGAIAGGVVGNEMERGSAQPRNKLELTVRMRNGEQRALLVEPNSYYRVGDSVRLTYQNGQMVIAP